MSPGSHSSEHYLQEQVIELRETCVKLEHTVEHATEKVGENEERLENLQLQIARMDGTILRMRADLPTKKDMEDMLTTTMNKHIAKGIWAIVVVAIGAAVTWVGNHLGFK